MRRLKVLHVLYGLGIGGIETLAVKLVNRMDPDRFEHIIVSLTGDDALLQEIEPGRARVYFLKKEAGADLRLYPEVTRIMSHERPDVIHTRNWSTFMEGMVPSLAARVPGRVHSFDGLNADNLGEEPPRRIWAQRLLLRMVQKIVARSEAMRRSMCEQLQLNPSRVQLIADGIDLERFDRPVDRNAVRARFGLAPDDYVIGIVARLDPVKDHHTLLRAMSRLAPGRPELKLLVVGGGPIDEELRAAARSSTAAHQIVFTGPQLDVPSLYHTLDLYVQPSLYEGVSGSILEAMSARLPVISTPVGGTVDIVLEGRTGLLSPVGEDGALADRILEVFSDPVLASGLARGARSFVEQHFSLQQVIEQYSRVYQEACGWVHVT